ncbi:DUF1206 domain-containing protein [Chelativorans salis]|uniref:DUF1206 domain-containing protein n=1 Tax=Chelativorans salis TaxID=2978478 RepID=A0ABT2LUW9_9HYPH|nr:DUF1206 domain-containing protein [Chelativorans sp. EGI FJ00035]MCT7378181.1 DUF1206 domain-containing protein [Chelativorans sp. EGI FJ00035]
MANEIWTSFRPLARAGYAARGLIYGVIGVFAALAAIGAGEAMGSRDALLVLLSSVAGSVLAYALVAGFAFYALWRLIQAGFDTDNHGTDPKGIAIRGGLLVSGLVYAALASYTLSLAGGGGSSGGGWAATLAAFVGARWVSAILALALAGAGMAHIIKAVQERYARYLKADAGAMKIIHPVAKTGLVARGLVFLILAFLLLTRTFRGGDQASSKAALEFIQSLPLGWLLLSLMGLGLIAFALYSFIEARYRRINVEDARM